MTRIPLLSALLLACAPPEPVELNDGTDSGQAAEAPPEIRLLYPPSDVDIELDDQGVLRTLVVVDILNLDFTPPPAENGDGQGHWHVNPMETYLTAPGDLFFELECGPSQTCPVTFNAGTNGIITVDLRQNDHSPLTDVEPDCDCSDLAEFKVVAAGAGSNVKSFEEMVNAGEIEWRPWFEEILDR